MHTLPKSWQQNGLKAIISTKFKHCQVTDLDVTDLGVSGPRIPFCATGALFLDRLSKHLSSVLGRTELCHKVRNPGPEKPQIIRNENRHLALFEKSFKNDLPPEGPFPTKSAMWNWKSWCFMAALVFRNAAKEQRRRHAGKWSSKRVFLESLFSSLAP